MADDNVIEMPERVAPKLLLTSDGASQLNIRLGNIKAAVKLAHDAIVSGCHDMSDDLANAHGVLDLARSEIERIQAELDTVEVVARHAEVRS